MGTENTDFVWLGKGVKQLANNGLLEIEQHPPVNLQAVRSGKIIGASAGAIFLNGIFAY